MPKNNHSIMHKVTLYRSIILDDPNMDREIVLDFLSNVSPSELECISKIWGSGMVEGDMNDLRTAVLQLQQEDEMADDEDYNV
jgi:hypothetical protein